MNAFVRHILKPWSVGLLLMSLASDPVQALSLDYQFKQCAEAVANARKNADNPGWWEQAELMFHDLPDLVAKLPEAERKQYQPRLDEWAPQIEAGVCVARRDRLVRRIDTAFKSADTDMADERPAGAERYADELERLLAESAKLKCLDAKALKQYQERHQELVSQIENFGNEQEFKGIVGRVERRIEDAERWAKEYEALPANDPNNERRFKRGMANDEVTGAEKILRALPKTHKQYKRLDETLLKLRKRLDLPRPRAAKEE